MKLFLQGETEEIISGTRLLAHAMGFEIGEGDKIIYVSKCEKGFSVKTGDKSAQIMYHTPTDFLRALSIATDAFRKKISVLLTQQPNFENCGIMLDVSRGAVIKVSRVKEIIGFIARMGFNCIMLYTEDVYEMKKYPYFGYMRGRYTKEELREIAEYARLLGVEAIPCIQTLAHLEYPLRWREFGEMKELDSVLLVGEEKTYELIEEMIKTMRECFLTDKIHIGMDEADGVGLGKYLQKHGLRNRFDILSEHLTRVLFICKKYKFKPMMWSDMFFRLGSKTNNYYDWDNVLPENIKELVPDGITQVYWDYYNYSELLYDNMFTAHKKMGCPIAFAGGVWMWSTYAVNHKQTFEATLPALRACVKHGISDVYATLWGDDGSECDVTEALYGLQLYAEYNYGGEPGLDKLDSMFEICTGYSAELFKLLDVDDFGISVDVSNVVDGEEYDKRCMCSPQENISKQLLYQNPLLGLFDKNIARIDVKTHYERIYKKLADTPCPLELEGMYECHKQFVKVVMKKSDIGIRLKEAYDSNDKAALFVLQSELVQLEKEIRSFHDLRMELWYKNNKPFGFEQVSNRLSAVESLTRIAANRVEAYLKGTISNLEELEQERLDYNGIEGTFFMEYDSRRIMSP